MKVKMTGKEVARMLVLGSRIYGANTEFMCDMKNGEKFLFTDDDEFKATDRLINLMLNALAEYQARFYWHQPSGKVKNGHAEVNKFIMDLMDGLNEYSPDPNQYNGERDEYYQQKKQEIEARIESEVNGE
jgi:hypothetical protein